MKLILIVTTISFILNLIWEYAQCAPFFIHSTETVTHFDMIQAALGDVVLTWVGYIVVSLLSKNLNWIYKKWRKPHWITLEITAITLAVVIEFWAFKTNRWAYTSINPLIFDRISIIPILQLLLLFPASFKISKLLIRL